MIIKIMLCFWVLVFIFFVISFTRRRLEEALKETDEVGIKDGTMLKDMLLVFFILAGGIFLYVSQTLLVNEVKANNEKKATSDYEYYLDGVEVDKNKISLKLYNYEVDDENKVVYLTSK